jgi:streptomycin 6-kinase
VKPVNLESDPAHVARLAPDVGELLDWTRGQLAIGPNRPWKVLWTRRKLRKILFEVEEQDSGAGRRLIGKTYANEKGERCFETLKLLAAAGMRPPSRYTVAQAVAWLPQRRLLLQEKAPGIQLLASIREQSERVSHQADCAGRWLAALHQMPVTAPEPPEYSALITRYAAELIQKLPAHQRRISAAAQTISGRLGARSDTLPSHGDFHPMNVYLDDSGRVTVIDLDTFSRRERACDVAYFTAQTAIMGYLLWGDFSSTAELRAAFLESYQSAARVSLDPGRLATHTAFAFLQSLHFELAILNTGNTAIVEPWLAAAALTKLP